MMPSSSSSSTRTRSKPHLPRRVLPRRIHRLRLCSSNKTESSSTNASSSLELLREGGSESTASKAEVPTSIPPASPSTASSSVSLTSVSGTTQVQFRVRYGTRFGQHLRVVGGHDRLGWWIIRDGLEMQWSEGDVWQASLPLPKGGVYEYKYILCEDFTGAGGVVNGFGHATGVVAVDWQRGNNQVLALRYDDTDVLEVNDVWDGDPSRSNTESPDGLSLTRENRLAAWVADMEREVNEGRTEIRGLRAQLEDARRELAFIKSRGGGAWRAEHAAAKEEASAASAAYKVEAAAREELQDQVSALVSEKEILEKRNAELQRQLKTSTQMFHQALGTCRRLLSMDGGDEAEPEGANGIGNDSGKKVNST